MANSSVRAGVPGTETGTPQRSCHRLEDRRQHAQTLALLYGLPEFLAQLELARSSYFYHRARVKVTDTYFALCVAASPTSSR